MIMCLDCKMEVSMAHAIKNPTHHVMATSHNPKVRSHIEGMINLHRRRNLPPEPLEGADETYNIRKDRAMDDTQVSLWWLLVPATIAMVIGIFVYRRNKEPVPDNSEDAYYG